MSKDPLQSVLRLRQMARDEAQSVLAACIRDEDDAIKALHVAERAIRHEQDIASSLDAGDGAVEAFAAWLPQGRAAITNARLACETAEAATAQARAVLTAARAAMESVEKLIEQRAEAKRLEGLRKDQAVLDETAIQLVQRRRRED